MEENTKEEFERIKYQDEDGDYCYFTLCSGGINLIADDGLVFTTQRDIDCFVNYARARLRAAKKIV